MDDEECLPENSSLNVYLQDLGFSDLQVSKKILPKPSSIKFEVLKPKTKWPQTETIDEDIIDQISIIVSTQMLFEEDILNIENLLSNFEVVKSGMLKCIFKDLFGLAIIFVGLCLYWIIGYFAFLFVSSFYAYNAAYYLKRKYFYRIRLKKLTSIIQSNFILLKKTVKFIEENKLIESKCESKSNSREFLQGFDFYKNFKNDFLVSVNEMINVFVTSTQKLIYKVPLYDYIENPEYYLCNNFKKDFEPVNLSKLYEIYLLLQSEFLQRLILSLIPNIKLSTNDNFNEINEIITETCLSLLKIKKVINKKFKFLFFNGIHSPTAKVEFKFPKKNGIPDNAYVKEFLLNIHETSKNFQKLLLNCRIIEENIKSEKVPDFVENELLRMQNNINSCQRNITDCLILFKRCNALKDKQDDVTVQKLGEIENSNEKINKVEIGYTDLDPKIEDEIFEMFLTNETADGITSDKDYWDFGDEIEKKLEKEYCKSVMKELKVKLMEKAKHWKKRERELLKKKGLIDITEEMLESESESTNDKNADELDSVLDKNFSCRGPKVHQNFKSDLEKFDNLKDGELDLKNFVFEAKTPSESQDVQTLQISKKDFLGNMMLESSRTTTEAQNDTDVMSEAGISNPENIQGPVAAFRKDFINDLNEARLKILKSSFVVDEELFCDTAEDDPS